MGNRNRFKEPEREDILRVAAPRDQRYTDDVTPSLGANGRT